MDGVRAAGADRERHDGVTPEQLAEAVNGAGEKFRALSVQEA